MSLTDRIFSVISQQILNGMLPAGSRLPSVRQLAIEHHVSNETAHRGYDKLVAHGYVAPRRGSGFYVKTAKPPIQDSKLLRWTQGTHTADDWRSLLRSELPYERRPGCGSLPDVWMDQAALSNALRSMGRIHPRALAEYETPRGYLALRQQLQIKLADQGIRALPDQIVTAAGATEALHLVLWSQVNYPGNYVLLEDPGPSMHVQRAMACGLDILHVPRHSDGPDIDVMRAICEKHRPRAFLCSSILQSPTSSSLSPHKAFQILKLADEFNFIIVDDDTYGDLLPLTDASQVTRLATMDQLKRVFHIGSFSKTLAPGLRVGFIAASPEHVERILLFKAAGLISNSTLGERVVYQFLSQGKYRHHCESLRSRLLEIREETKAMLTAAGCSFPTPTCAGMYLWASLGDRINASAIARAMRDQDFLMAPGYLFGGAENTRSSMRFNIPATHNSPALAALGALLQSKGFYPVFADS
jgi:DNA-binding transcriptional MocR family regulator